MRESTIQSTLTLAILGLISQRPMTGYDLRKVFAATPMGHFSSSPGAIYPALQRLENSGLLKGTVEGRDTLRPKRVYTLTETGKEALRQRLEKTVTQDDVIWHMDDLVLRFAFMGDILGREKTLQYLKQLLMHVENYIPSLQEHLNTAREAESPYGAFAMEHGIEVYQAYARWTKHVIARLAGN
jgi:DNA-binding PadR family transcriptional regulator